MQTPRVTCLAFIAVTAAVVTSACDDKSTRVIEPRRTAAVTAGARTTAGSGDTVVQTPLDSLTAVATKLYAEGAYDSARVVYTHALTAANAVDDSAAIARIVTSLGLAAWRLGDFPEARRLSATALAIKQRMRCGPTCFSPTTRSVCSRATRAGSSRRRPCSIVPWRSPVSSATGATWQRPRRISRSSRTTRRSPAARSGFIVARIRRGRGRLRTEWNATVNLAGVDVRLGNPLAAIQGVDDLRRRYPTPNHPVGEENALGQLASAYDLVGESQRAIAALDTAIRIARSSDLVVQEAENLRLLAEIYEKTGDRRRALSVLDEAARIATTAGVVDEVADMLRRRAMLLGTLGNAARARESVTKALALHREAGAELNVLTDLLINAELAARAGDHAAARDRLASARLLSNKLRVAPARSELAVTTARMADARGDARNVLAVLAAARGDIRSGGVAAEVEADALAARAHRRLGQLDAAIARGRRAAEGIEPVRRSLGLGELRTAFVTDKARVYADLVLALLEADRTAEALEVADNARSRALIEHMAAARLSTPGTPRALKHSSLSARAYCSALTRC